MGVEEGRMATKGERTRKEILKIAQSIVLQRGFGGTSIERILEEAKITKGGFFYHFDGKNDLARNLILQYLEEDNLFFTQLFDQARDLSEDSLQQMLLFLKLMADAMAKLPDVHPGCLVATFTYESQQFNEDVQALVAEGLLHWRELFVEQLDLVLQKYQPRNAVSSSELADMLTATIEGGIIMSRALNDPQVLVQQIMQYRNYIRVLFDAA